MDSKLLVGLIKEVVKNEVKQQVKEELAKLAAQRAEGGMMDESSVLDMIQPERYEEDGWETMDYRMQQTPKQIPSTGNAGLDAIQKALNRDYTQLTKVFTKQEKEKGLR